MRKLILSTLMAIAILFVVGINANVSAHGASSYDSTAVRHAYRPVTKTDRWMNARVDNFVPQQVTRLVCVEARNVNTGRNTHLGCLTIPLDAYNSDGQWAFEFNAPTWMLGAGHYNVNYTYQGNDGMWHLIRSVELYNTPGIYHQ